MTTEESDQSLPPTEVYASDPSNAPRASGPRPPGPRPQGPRKVGNRPRRRQRRGTPNGLPSGVPDLGSHQEIPEPTGEIVELTDLRGKSTEELVTQALELGIDSAGQMHKIELLFQVAKRLMQGGAALRGSGCVEVVSNHGFLRYPENSYAAGAGDIYLGSQLLRRNGLRSGDEVNGLLAPPRDQDKFFGMGRIETINGEVPDKRRARAVFENLTPMFPDERFVLERNIRAEENITGRIIDMIAPIGKGQRGLLVAPPKTGKTVMLQHIAHAIEENHPEAELIILLIDERPEEVTEMKRMVRGEVVSSTFDEPASRHVQVADMVIEKARRRVEAGKDVVIMLDSITRLARAHNTIAPQSGRVLTGGVDSQALQRPKRFFGSARNIENGGSLTIIATALVETGSRMDEVIYEEFKGTGNMEIHLDRRLADRRSYPSIVLNRSGTRREELLLEPDVLQKTWLLRKVINDMDEIKASAFLADEVRATKTNEEFFQKMRRG